VLVSAIAQGVALLFRGRLNAAAQVHDVGWRRGGVAARRAGAAAGNAAPDSDFPSGNPDCPHYRNGWRSAWRAFFAELRRLGYVEGENLIVERYSAEGHHDRYAPLAREIVTRNPDLIVTGTNPVVIAFRLAREGGFQNA
jgi:hypothetical protein